MSLLLAHGHPEAAHYTLGDLLDETRIVKNRINHQMANDATLLQSVIGSVLSKSGGANFQKHIDKLREE